jgi:hypothetical protein
VDTTLRYVRSALDEARRLWPAAPGYLPAARSDTLGGLVPDEPGRLGAGAVAAAAPRPAGVARSRPVCPWPSQKSPAHAYKPFGAGQRACIGRQFALHEAVLALGLVLRRYHRPTATGCRSLSPSPPNRAVSRSYRTPGAERSSWPNNMGGAVESGIRAAAETAHGYTERVVAPPIVGDRRFGIERSRAWSEPV